METWSIGGVRRAGSAVVAAGCLWLVWVGSALGATSVGQLFAPIDGCASSSLYLQTGVASGSRYTIPSDGVVTSWSFEVGNAAISGLRLEIASPLVAGSRTIVGEAAAGTQTPGIASSYLTRIPVHTGDIVGIFSGGGGNCILGSGAGADAIDYHAGDLSPGASGMFTQLTGNKVPVTATVEPDADHDGFGDETQDQCRTDASTQGPCPPTPPPPASHDTAPPSVTTSVAKLLKLSKHGSISFVVTTSEDAGGTAAGTISLSKRARVVRFKTTKLELSAGKPTKITLKLSRSALKPVRGALKRHKLKAKITVALKDAAGNRTVKKLSAKLD